MSIQQLLSPRRVALAMPAASKQRLLEDLCTLLRTDGLELGDRQVLDALLARERLGSTGIGEGVALPHGRVAGLTHAIGAFATLDHAMDYDAIDRKPVVMAFALLVPANATQEHLRILSELAAVFSNKSWRRALLDAKNSQELYQCLTRSTVPSGSHDADAHHQRPV